MLVLGPAGSAGAGAPGAEGKEGGGGGRGRWACSSESSSRAWPGSAAMLARACSRGSSARCSGRAAAWAAGSSPLSRAWGSGGEGRGGAASWV